MLATLHLCILYNTSIAGRAALDVSKAHFNKEASQVYGQLSGEEKKQLNEGPEVEVTMTDSEVNQRVRKVTKRVQTLVKQTMPACAF